MPINTKANLMKAYKEAIPQVKSFLEENGIGYSFAGSTLRAIERDSDTIFRNLEFIDIQIRDDRFLPYKVVNRSKDFKSFVNQLKARFEDVFVNGAVDVSFNVGKARVICEL